MSKTAALKRILPYLVSVVLIAGAAYVVNLAIIAPNHQPFAAAEPAPQSHQPSPDRQLIIPSIGVNAAIISGTINSLHGNQVLQRQGSPSDGNFVLAGHSFVFGYAPRLVKQSSVLYNLGDIKAGAEVVVYWDHHPHQYRISRVYQVSRYQTSIEQPSQETKLTIYTCTMAGSDGPRIVAEASPQS